MAELADAADLKSAGAILVGSSPSPGTTPDLPLKKTLTLISPRITFEPVSVDPPDYLLTAATANTKMYIDRLGNSTGVNQICPG